ncbi:MAG: glycerol-3-phosphate acyltransferase, partial [Lachnospiraceae bacterium]|nr:glycerol-3-phosphate acyltransferase [Lachnospiraceae bacterium]
MKVVLLALICYLIGCINPAYIIGKIKGFDIRSKGSMNA